MATYTAVPFARRILDGATATLFTAGSAGGAIVKEVMLCNTSPRERYVTLHIVPAGDSEAIDNALMWMQKVDGHSTLVIALSSVMEVGDFITGFADYGSLIACHISGVNIS